MKFQQIEPANARGKIKDEMWDDERYHAEEKLDGHRAIAQFCKDKTRFTSRRRSVKDGLFVENTANLPHLHNPCTALLGTVLDGEIIVEGGSNSMKVSSIMGAKPDKAIARQEEAGQWVRFVVFDCLFFKGKDVRARSLYERRAYMKEAVEDWNSLHVDVVRMSQNTKRRFLERIYKAGGEGIIIKDREAPYHQKHWAKVKRSATYDVVVMRYADAKEVSEKSDGTVSTTKYKGMVGAIVFGQYVDGKLKEFGQTSGFTDAVRAELTKNGRDYVGTVMEIACQERITKTGKFRHPRFKRWRDDKRAHDCVFRIDES